jgi:hypothetical protein
MKNCPQAATKLPTDGHGFCPVVATKLPTRCSDTPRLPRRVVAVGAPPGDPLGGAEAPERHPRRDHCQVCRGGHENSCRVRFDRFGACRRRSGRLFPSHDDSSCRRTGRRRGPAATDVEDIHDRAALRQDRGVGGGVQGQDPRRRRPQQVAGLGFHRVAGVVPFPDRDCVAGPHHSQRLRRVGCDVPVGRRRTNLSTGPTIRGWTPGSSAGRS